MDAAVDAERTRTRAPGEEAMILFHDSNPQVTGIEPAVLEAHRQINKMMVEQMPAMNVRTPEGLALLRAVTRPPQGAPQLKPADVVIPGPGGNVRLHIFTPERAPRGVIVRIHGGGWAAGAPEDDEALNDRIARACGVVIVSPEYRLTPDVTIREQILDCVAAVRWVAEQSEKRFGTAKLMLAGTSAGGHLAASTLLRLRDLGDAAFAKVVGVHLDCGVYDLSLSPSARSATDKTPVLPRQLLDGLVDVGLPGVPAEERRAAALSPLYADLAGMPPALFTVGSLDPLLDDTLFLSARWKAAGNEARLDVWPEAAHAFTNMSAPLAGPALERTVGFISEALTRAEVRS
jgi:acetyl esterase/lipase